MCALADGFAESHAQGMQAGAKAGYTGLLLVPRVASVKIYVGRWAAEGRVVQVGDLRNLSRGMLFVRDWGRLANSLLARILLYGSESVGRMRLLWVVDGGRVCSAVRGLCGGRAWPGTDW
jgi:hypothetical protein